MKPVLSLQDISKSFVQNRTDVVPVLRSLSLDVFSGDFITIVGSNGAGKSTLFQCISGRMGVDSGKIFLDGADITAVDQADRAAWIAQVFQDPKTGSAPRMTVAENIALAEYRGKSRGLQAALTDSDRKRYTSRLSKLGLGLENRISTSMEFLSGGQRQAVALLMATIVEPKILLLDEHTASLDPKTSKRILSVTDRTIRERGITALMITHNLEDALRYGNRLVFLHEGKIFRDFSKEEKDALTPQDLYTMMSALN